MRVLFHPLLLLACVALGAGRRVDPGEYSAEDLIYIGSEDVLSNPQLVYPHAQYTKCTSDEDCNWKGECISIPFFVLLVINRALANYMNGLPAGSVGPDVNPPAKICRCDKNHEGTRCQFEIPQCDDTSCGDGGVCRMLSQGDSSTHRFHNYHITIPYVSPPKRTHVLTCECEDGYFGRSCDRQELCTKNGHCNGGLCTRDAEFGVASCTDCPRGTTGELCEVQTDPCIGYCLNGATCAVVVRRGKRRAQCTCPPSYKGIQVSLFAGPRCEEVDHCTRYVLDHRGEKFCMNEGICSSDQERSAPTCACTRGYRGDRCEYMAGCHDSTVCGSGGTCMPDESDTKRGYRCVCDDSKFGNRCQYTKKCVEDPSYCTENSTCDTDNGACVCSAGFRGDRCKYHVCRNVRCKNGGTCAVDADNRAVCLCTSLYTGPRCSIVRDPCDQGLYDGSTRQHPCHPYNTKRCVVVEYEDVRNVTRYGAECRCRGNATGPGCVRGLGDGETDGAGGGRCGGPFEQQQTQECHWGTCLVLDSGEDDRGTCKCNRGFDGSFCDMKMDCKDAPCAEGGGTCANTVLSSAQWPSAPPIKGWRNGWQCNGTHCNVGECLCNPGFAGAACQHACEDYCGPRRHCDFDYTPLVPDAEAGAAVRCGDCHDGYVEDWTNPGTCIEEDTQGGSGELDEHVDEYCAWCTKWGGTCNVLYDLSNTAYNAVCVCPVTDVIGRGGRCTTIRSQFVDVGVPVSDVYAAVYGKQTDCTADTARLGCLDSRRGCMNNLGRMAVLYPDASDVYTYSSVCFDGYVDVVTERFQQFVNTLYPECSMVLSGESPMGLACLGGSTVLDGIVVGEKRATGEGRFKMYYITTDVSADDTDAPLAMARVLPKPPMHRTVSNTTHLSTKNLFDTYSAVADGNLIKPYSLFNCSIDTLKCDMHQLYVHSLSRTSKRDFACFTRWCIDSRFTIGRLGGPRRTHVYKTVRPWSYSRAKRTCISVYGKRIIPHFSYKIKYMTTQFMNNSKHIDDSFWVDRDFINNHVSGIDGKETCYIYNTKYSIVQSVSCKAKHYAWCS